MTDSTDTLRPIKRALISVSDKTGLIDFARALAARGVALISTGGTAKTLQQAGLTVSDVASVTGFPEMLDGRVKTLHPAVHGGILARRDMQEHLDAIAEHNIAPIDLVVVNLYPFAATRARGGNFDDCLENIDIGGPALIRAAAKNHDGVAVVTDASDYASILTEMTAHDGATTLALRRKLAGLAFARTAAYDADVSAWFAELEGERFPKTFSVAGTLKETLRYGENPHQHAAFYLGSAQASGKGRPGIATATQLQGKELSFNNLNDTDAAYECVAEFAEPAVAIIKHANPCGVATGTNLREAFLKALACDPVSAFGGIIAVNRPLDAAMVEALGKLFLEVIIAPEVTLEAKALLAKKQNLRLLSAGALPDPRGAGMTLRSVAGGYLLQTRDDGHIGEADLKIMTQRAPTAAERADMLFAFRVAKHVKSNAIVYVKAGATVGIGAGQMSRVDSSRIAAHKAEEAGKAAGLAQSPTIGSVVASDAFFPFADGLEAAIAAGATAVIQPGGSVRDNEVIAAADKAGIAMVFTGMRHFRH